MRFRLTIPFPTTKGAPINVAPGAALTFDGEPVGAVVDAEADDGSLNVTVDWNGEAAANFAAGAIQGVSLPTPSDPPLAPAGPPAKRWEGDARFEVKKEAAPPNLVDPATPPAPPKRGSLAERSAGADEFGRPISPAS